MVCYSGKRNGFLVYATEKCRRISKKLYSVIEGVYMGRDSRCDSEMGQLLGRARGS